jgi:phosphate transport system permease protein
LTPAPPDASAAVAPDGPIAPKRHSLKRTFTATIAERSYFGLTILAGLIAVVAIGFFFWKTFAQTTETWSTFGVWGFITGTVWNAQPITGQPVFGALPFIYGTAVTATIAMALAVPLAIGVALATTFVLPRRVRAPLAGMIDLLAAVPSVVYGLWGIVIMVPWINPRLGWISSHQMITVFGLAALCGVVSLVLPRGVLKVVGFAVAAFLFLSWFLALIGVIGRSFRLLDGPVLSGSYVSAGLVLAVMVLPIITAITREVFVTVPREQEEAAYALGATRWEMIRDAVLPWSRSGIVGASTLGLGRAVGETIAIAILIGDQPNILNSLFGPGATLAGWIALQTGEASGLQLSALTALAVVLFGLTLMTNLGARLVTRRSPRSGGRTLTERIFFRRATGEVAMPEIEMQDDDREFADASEPVPVVPAAVRENAGIADVSPKRRRQARLATVGIYLAVVLALIPLGLVIGEIVVQGVQELSIDFFTQLPPVDPSNTAGAGISNALVGTLIMVGIGTAIAAPLGILTALLMYESALSGRIGTRIAWAMGLFVDLLLGVPSIVVGMICYLAIVIATQQFDALTGGIALSIIMFPIIVRTADEVVRLVPSDLSEAALALGAPKWRTALRIVIPAALPGILTGVVLAIARAAGETAPLLFTAGSSNFFSTDIFQPMASMPIVIYNLVINARTPQSTQFAWGATLVLVAMILMLNLLARFVGRLARGTER